MKKLATIFLLFVTGLAVFISFHSVLGNYDLSGKIFQTLFVPTTVYLVINLITHLTSKTPVFASLNGLQKTIALYCLTISSVLIAAGILSSHTWVDFVSTLVFAPLAVYFFVSILPRHNWATINPSQQRVYAAAAAASAGKMDVDRRNFLKLIGAAGISIFLYNLLFRRDMAPLFGNLGPTSPPVLKDSPADSDRSPTQGYYITQIDDSPTAYYGFVNNMGQWFIMRQDTDKSYRYSRGDKDFTGNWADRRRLSYDYFDSAF